MDFMKGGKMFFSMGRGGRCGIWNINPGFAIYANPQATLLYNDPQIHP
jgi:hypothetical protein